MFKNTFFKKFSALFLALILVFSLTACSEESTELVSGILGEIIESNIQSTSPTESNSPSFDGPTSTSFNPAIIPAYDGQPWIYVNNNQPFFTEDEITTKDFEYYSELDELKRCGVAFACLSPATQPTENEERGNISRVQPSGWKFNGKNNNVKYACVEGAYLYNRCHLIMWALSAENENHLNLITGTRYMNIDGMLPWETKANEYVDETGNHLMYRVTPVYTGENLVADGVLMEGYSVEDNGEGLSFCVYAYNVQPGVEINYETGESWFNGIFLDTSASSVIYDERTSFLEKSEAKTYILNTNSKKIHTEDCEFASSMSEKNRKEFTGTLQELIDDGYTRCSSCKPE